MEPKPVFFETPEQLRAWFDQHADSQTELWVGFRRKATGLATVSWSEAVDEALCVGWIDGVRYGVDETGYTMRFTPRKRGSIWSAVNVGKVAALTAEGRMKAAGLSAFEARQDARTAVYSYENPPVSQELEPEQVDRLHANPGAWAWWTAQAPYYRKQASAWVCSAKQAATRDRRLETLIADCAAGRPIKPMSYGKSSRPTR